MHGVASVMLNVDTATEGGLSGSLAFFFNLN